MNRIVVIIVAAGRGLRAGGVVPKQWQALGNARVIDQSCAAFAHLAAPIIVVVHPDDLAAADLPGCTIVAGGATRGASVQAGLKAARTFAPDRVLIHDAARPLVSMAVIDTVLRALDHHDGAAPALAVTDALWTGAEGLVTGAQDRRGLYRAQTPQGFDFAAITAAYAAHPADAADDVQVARAAGLNVAIVEGEAQNFKITMPGDLARAQAIVAQRPNTERTPMDIRTGNGFDVHRFGVGDHVWLCGVKIPHDRCLQGHSDADVSMHAVTDAIYGALGQGDIGQHFPPSDMQWKGAASHIFLSHACALAREQGFTITHADCTLICEYPKIGPHAAAMKIEMARIMGLSPDRVSVKATTSEQLGFTGRGEGIAALATATLVKT